MQRPDDVGRRMLLRAMSSLMTEHEAEEQGEDDEEDEKASSSSSSQQQQPQQQHSTLGRLPGALFHSASRERGAPFFSGLSPRNVTTTFFGVSATNSSTNRSNTLESSGTLTSLSSASSSSPPPSQSGLSGPSTSQNVFMFGSTTRGLRSAGSSSHSGHSDHSGGKSEFKKSSDLGANKSEIDAVNKNNGENNANFDEAFGNNRGETATAQLGLLRRKTSGSESPKRARRIDEDSAAMPMQQRQGEDGYWKDTPTFQRQKSGDLPLKQQLDERLFLQVQAATGAASSAVNNNTSSIPPVAPESQSTRTQALMRQQNSAGRLGTASTLSAKGKNVKSSSTPVLRSASIQILSVKHLPVTQWGFRESHFFVKITAKNKKGEDIELLEPRTLSQEADRRHHHSVHWNAFLAIPYSLDQNDEEKTVKELEAIKITFTLCVEHRAILRDEVLGFAEMTLGELAERPVRNLCLQLEDFDFLLESPGGPPSMLSVSVTRISLPNSFPALLPGIPAKKYPKHAMILTRGTRGDVQPFVALSVGLAERLGWMVTLCTELRYLSNLKKYFRERMNSVKVPNYGYVRVRPTGGDTMSRVDSKLGRWALRNGHNILQMMMMGKAEIENFPSEPVIYYWTKTLKPDIYIFGFTMANITMILSEALSIPAIGFILQPTCIPSAQYPPLYDIDDEEGITENEVSLRSATPPAAASPPAPSWSIARMFGMKGTSEVDQQAVKHPDVNSSSDLSINADKAKWAHKKVSRIKGFFENNPFYSEVNTIRQRRGLERLPRWKVKEGSFMNIRVMTFSSKTWKDIVDQNIPVIVPINEYAFGGKPVDWSTNTVLTDFIYLPQLTTTGLNPKLSKFVASAKADGAKLVMMGFSSMPVSHRRMFALGELIVTKCASAPRAIIVTGERDSSIDAQKAAMLDQRIIDLEATGKVCIVNGAPFQALFPLLDCAVIHGGLGTTADALRAGIPVIVTGVLLMDQRFWGVRVNQLGVGPPPCHHSVLHERIVGWVDHALDPESDWAKRAKEVAIIMKPEDGDLDGIEINVRAVENLVSIAHPHLGPRPMPLAAETPQEFENE